DRAVDRAPDRPAPDRHQHDGRGRETGLRWRAGGDGGGRREPDRRAGAGGSVLGRAAGHRALVFGRPAAGGGTGLARGDGPAGRGGGRRGDRGNNRPRLPVEVAERRLAGRQEGCRHPDRVPAGGGTPAARDDRRRNQRQPSYLDPAGRGDQPPRRDGRNVRAGGASRSRPRRPRRRLRRVCRREGVGRSDGLANPGRAGRRNRVRARHRSDVDRGVAGRRGGRSVAPRNDGWPPGPHPERRPGPGTASGRDARRPI
ncbi:MAG: hypothetical protein AVDCRST_MAG73-2899, partial [uncultured Thermomicrobiales bacterium]